MTPKRKLHLGCGQVYLEGYLNIDYPNSEQTVQSQVVADEHKDLLGLRYERSTIEEVRLHHVFEHFPRSISCALLCSWNSWMRHEGILRIEVPDAEKCMKVLLNPFLTRKQKGVSQRHLFGSQEEHWAVHYHGYTRRSLPEMLDLFGFRTTAINRFRWQDLYNLEVTAKKQKDISQEECVSNARLFLSQFLVDESESEQRQMATWMEQFQDQISKTGSF